MFLVLLNSFVLTSTAAEILRTESRGTSTILVGKMLSSVLDGNDFVSFWKIPYAEPPIGELRFKAPRGWIPWTQNTYNYSKIYTDTCSSSLSEDCLYLSVFMPRFNPDSIPRPVVVWIHEQSHLHGPDFLIDENIVVVTVSYRTSVLGFLNTGDEFALGNMGAKDIMTALKWVQDNIRVFDGDPSKVTVMGAGSAATIVASLLLTKVAEGLFARVIIQSGSALSPADYKKYNFNILNKLFQNMYGSQTKFNRTKLYHSLMEASTEELRLASINLFDSTEVRDHQRLINPFGPTVETFNKQTFMTKPPLEVYKRKMTNNNVDVIMGYTNLESLYELKGFVENKNLLKYLNYNFQYVLPFEGEEDDYGSKRYKKIRRRIKEFYFVNGTIADRSLRRYAKYVSDQVIYPALRQAKLHSEISCKNVYLYRFPFKGVFNERWRSSLAKLNLSGATSGDDACYIFRCKSLNAYDSPRAANERHFIKKIARLLANFARFGNPTPSQDDDVLGDLKWDPLVPNGRMRGLNLGKRYKMVNVSEEKRIQFWDNLKEEFFPDSKDVE